MKKCAGILLGLVFVSAVVVTHAQWLNYPSPGMPRPNGKGDLTAKTPRTPDGKPDLSDAAVSAQLSSTITGMGARCHAQSVVRG